MMSPEQIDPRYGSGTPTGSTAPHRQTKSFKQGNLILVVLFAAGLACVYLLSLRSGPAQASAQQQADETMVTSALEQFQAEIAKRGLSTAKATSLVDTFYYETRQRQVPLEQLAGNPFEFQPPAGEQAVSLGVAPGKGDGTTHKMASLGEALAAVKQLRLQSILAGSNGATAMISNNLLREGQVICGWTVAKIKPQSVVMTWKDKTYELRMQ